MERNKYCDTSIIVTPERSALLQGHGNKLKVLVRVQAPDINPNVDKERPSYRLGIVLDRSGSMAGHPLEEAKRCATFIVDQLRRDDMASLVVFDNQVNVLCGVEKVGDKKSFRSAIASIHSGGSTNLHGGWVEGAKQLAQVVKDHGLNRVILLSDGNANEGMTEINEIASQCGEFAARNITTSTYGLGRDFNEDLMVAMAKSGRGNHYYGESAKDLFEPFFEEFALISNLWLRDLEIQVQCVAGVQVSMLNDYPLSEIASPNTWRLPDLAYQSEAWCLLELTVPQNLVSSADGQLSLITVKVQGKDLDGNTILVDPISFSLPCLPAAAWETILPDELVQRRVSEVEASRHLDRIREAARQGDWGLVKSLLEEARRLYANNPWLKDILQSIETYADNQDVMFLRKQAMYSSEKLKSRLSAKEEVQSIVADAELPAYLRRKGAQGQSAFDDDKL